MPHPDSEDHRCEFEVIRTEEDLRALLPEWETLWSGVAGIRVAQSPHWCLHTWKILEKTGDLELFVVAVRSAGDLVGVIPLVLAREAGVKVLRHLGLGFVEFSDVVLRDDLDKAAVVDQVISELAVQNGIAKISIKNLPDESPLSIAMRRRKLAVTRWTSNRVFIKWAEGEEWDAYMERHNSKSSLQNYARRHRKLVRETGAVLAREQDPTEISRIVDWIFQNKIADLQRRGIRTDLTEQSYLDLMVNALSSQDPTNHLAIYTLKAGDRIIAANIAAHGVGTTEGLIITHDPEYAGYSPGKILVEHAVKTSFDAKEVFDLGFLLADMSPWKQSWLTHTSSVRSIDLYLSIPSALRFELRELVYNLDRRVKRVVRRLRNLRPGSAQSAA